MMFLPIGQFVLRTSSKPSTYLTFRICQRSTESSSCPTTFRWTCPSLRGTSFLQRVSSTTCSSGTPSKGIRRSLRPPSRPSDLRWFICCTLTPALLGGGCGRLSTALVQPETRRLCSRVFIVRSEEHTSELQSLTNLVCR